MKLLVDLDAHGEKRPLAPGQDAGGGAGPPSEPAAKQARGLDGGQPKGNPIDHIFQFHRALTVELQLFNTDDSRSDGWAVLALEPQKIEGSSGSGGGVCPDRVDGAEYAPCSCTSSAASNPWAHYRCIILLSTTINDCTRRATHAYVVRRGDAA